VREGERGPEREREAVTVGSTVDNRAGIHHHRMRGTMGGIGVQAGCHHMGG
jgi:hypothetical protein